MDGAHLKGEFKGSILHAVYMDGEDHIVPIGYGICKSESIDSWTWFLEKLHECIGEMENLSFITDRAASIAVGIQNVFPNAVHGICAFHLLQNVRAKYGKNDKTKTMFWDIVQAYKTSDFDEAFDRFCRCRPREGEFLSGVPLEKWTRAYFPGLRYDLLTSNSAESMNAMSKDARKLPVTTLVEFFRASLQKWFYERRTIAGIP